MILQMTATHLNVCVEAFKMEPWPKMCPFHCMFSCPGFLNQQHHWLHLAGPRFDLVLSNSVAVREVILLVVAVKLKTTAILCKEYREYFVLSYII